MRLMIGLGNPGEKFKNNRHNVGKVFIEAFGKMGSIGGDIRLLETDCFMNESGKWVAQKVRLYKISPTDLFVVHDDLDIPLGQFKIQFGVGPKVHYGVNSIEAVLGTKDFWRVRIGVDARDQNRREEGEKYVLEDFTGDEQILLDSLFSKIGEQVRKVLFS